MCIADSSAQLLSTLKVCDVARGILKIDTNDCIQSQNSGNYNSILNTLFNRT